MSLIKFGHCVSFILLMCHSACCIDLTKVNLAHQYDPDAEIQFNHRVVSKDNSLIIFYELNYQKVDALQMTILNQPNYESIDHDTLSNFVIDTLRIIDRVALVQLEIDRPKSSQLLLFCFSIPQSEKQLLYDVFLKEPEQLPSYYPVDGKGYPIISNFIDIEDGEIAGDKGRYHIYQYSDNFMGADPAMGPMKAIAPSIDIDSSYFIARSLKGFADGSFYLVQEDSLDEIGLTLLKVPAYFPKCKKLDELIGPLQYITTESENQSLNSGNDTRGVFERFWINTYGSKLMAKVAIRKYYKKVENSNRLFTEYKAGWKTDRGILHIVFGKPLIVIRSARSEIWRYGDGTEFEFIRISTLFAPDMYSLKRDIKYEEIWYNQVGKLRQG